MWQARWFGPLYPLLYGGWMVRRGAGRRRSPGRPPAAETALGRGGRSVRLLPQPVRVVGVQPRGALATAGALAGPVWRTAIRVSRGTARHEHSVSRKHSDRARSATLGGEVGSDEVEHAGRRPVEQRVDGVAVLGDGASSAGSTDSAQGGDRLADVITSASRRTQRRRSSRRRRRRRRRGVDRRQPLAPQSACQA